MPTKETCIIAKYETLVFSCFYATGYDMWYIQFVDFFNDTNRVFFSTFKKKFPNYELQVYGHKTKPLDDRIKDEILIFIKEPFMKKNLRDFNLGNLL